MDRTNGPRLILCLSLLTGLAACGGGNDSTDAGPAQSQAPVAPPSLPGLDATKQSMAAVAAESVAVAGEQKSKPCLSCHSVDNFAGMDAAALEASMQAMRNGEIAHLPLPDSLSDQDLADIAAYLAEAAS